MEKIAIITDSCADIPVDLVEKYNIYVLPMVIQCEDGEYKDGIEITPGDIYDRLKNEIPKTSTPTGEDVLATFEKIKNDGYNKAIALILSSGLSGSYNQIRMYAEDFSDIEIKVLDSKQASIGCGAIALLMSEYVRNGATYTETVSYAEKLIADTKVFFGVDTLEYLVKGGRIGKATGFVGSLLDIKPVLSFDEDGVICAVDKVRGRKKVISRVGELVTGIAGDNPERKFYILSADGDCSRDCDMLEEKLKGKCNGYLGVFHSQIGAALSIHLGSGVIGAGIVFVD